ncbi:hypothetical protein ACTID9_02165 [Brevibacillus fluminis]|uniref:hypothetical protein n=1 Tax=Brevibacillus fluminis TaxID=511487 RepID=UPI003F88B940
MKATKYIAAIAVSIGLLAAGCSAGEKNTATTAGTDQNQAQSASQQPAQEQKKKQSPTDYAKAAEALVAELEKGKDGGTVDWAKAQKMYSDNLKALVQARDSENEGQVNDQLEAAMNAGKSGSLSAGVVAELHEKLMQNIGFLSMRHDFKEANEKFSDKASAKREVNEAKEFYDGLLKGMVEKRDAAYSSQMGSAIDSGFTGMMNAIDKGDSLSFNLGKQIVDKTLMKAFYFASGAEKGYGYKLENMVKEGTKEDLKAEQAEAWAFFQSLKGYLIENDKASTEFINQQFDLTNDVKNIKGDAINQAFVHAFAATAKGEYTETMENWGKDKAMITALEGALFIDVINADLPKALGGEAQAKTLIGNAQKLLDEVKAGNKEKAVELHKQVLAALDQVAAYGK